MDKRYQVFVSSTYADLKEERQHVIQTLMEMDCIPAGMELFPAADEEQWEFIKKIINDCDYYLLIIGGRYGSITAEGISYTEKEFDYAVEIGLKVIALVHGAPGDIPLGKSEQNPDLSEKLRKFKHKVMEGRLVKEWQSASEIPGLVSLSLTKTMKTYPSIGWVRANHVASEQILAEINHLRKENVQLANSFAEIADNPQLIVDEIADFDSDFTIRASHMNTEGRYQGHTINFKVPLSWRKIFTAISPYLVEEPSEESVKRVFTEYVHASEDPKAIHKSIEDQDFKTVRVQLEAYGLIKLIRDPMASVFGLKWGLTKYGSKMMMECRVIK